MADIMQESIYGALMLTILCMGMLAGTMCFLFRDREFRVVSITTIALFVLSVLLVPVLQMDSKPVVRPLVERVIHPVWPESKTVISANPLSAAISAGVCSQLSRWVGSAPAASRAGMSCGKW